MNTLATVVATATTILAVRSQIKMTGIDSRLEFQDFPHTKWDLENPISEMHINSKGEPVYIWESRALENSLRKAAGGYYVSRNFFGAIALLAWITAFGY